MRSIKTCAENHTENFESGYLATAAFDSRSKNRQLRHFGNIDFTAASTPTTQKRYGLPREISKYEILDRESNVLATEEGTTLLVDTVEYGHDIDLWLLLLQFKKRVDGLKGIAIIWDGLRARKVDLPTKGPAADLFWKAFISLGQPYERSTEAVVDYATSLLLRNGSYYERLYEEIINYWLRVKPKNAVKWHKILRSRFPPPHGILIRLCVVATSNEAAIDAFRIIYQNSPERNIYDCLVSFYCASGNYDLARRWHHFLVRHGDLPSEDIRSKPHYRQLRQLIVDTPQPLSNVQSVPNRKIAVVSKKEVPSLKKQAFFQSSYVASTSITDKLSSYGFGDYLLNKPRIFDDKTCARLISTEAFSLKLILDFLAGLGMKKFGPVALHALALRVTDVTALAREIKRLESLGMAVDDNTYSKAVRHFVKHKETEVLSNMLHSDLHPDAYDDTEVQQRLLLWYLKKKKWLEAYRTLEILALEDPKARIYVWNKLLKYFIRSAAKWRWIKFVKLMKICGIVVDDASVKTLFDHRLATRQAGRNISSHSNGPYDNMSSFANFCIEILEGGGHVPMHIWHETVKRLGMAGQMDELAFLLIHLARNYLPSGTGSENATSAHLRALLNKNDPNSFSAATTGFMSEMSTAFRKMFNESLIDAILSWGFINGGKKNEEDDDMNLLKPSLSLFAGKIHKGREKTTSERSDQARSPQVISTSRSMPAWAKGVELVGQLKKLGVPVNSNVVLKSIRHRLWTLYGPAISSRPRNREMKRLHRHTLLQTIMLINQAWGESLFKLDFDEMLKRKDLLGEDNPKSDKRLKLVDNEDLEPLSSTEHGNFNTRCQESTKPIIARRERFLVYVFGEKRYISKSEKRRVVIREWAHLLEEAGDTAWIGL